MIYYNYQLYSGGFNLKKVIVQILDGITPKNPLAPIVLSFNDEFFIIEEMGGKIRKPVPVATYKIPIKNILATIVSSEKEVTEKSKSVVVRGLSGGVLFGPVGLFLGGLSGIGNKKRTTTNYIYVISYKSSTGEIKNVTFSVVLPALNNVRSLDESLKILLSLGEENSSSETIL